MIIYNKKTYSFNLPKYLGNYYVSVDLIGYGIDIASKEKDYNIDRITFYAPAGQTILFSVDINIHNPENLLNKNTLAYIKAKIDAEVD
jgi:hypothetical protein